MLREIPPICRAVRRVRLAARMTQEEAARRNGISLKTYRSYETYRVPRFHRIEKMEEVFGIDDAALFGVDVDTENWEEEARLRRLADTNEERGHYQALTLLYRLERNAAVMGGAILSVVLALVAVDAGRRSWWQIIVFGAFALGTYGALCSMVAGWIWHGKHNLDFRYLSQRISRRDAGLHYYVGRDDGSVMRWRGEKYTLSCTFASDWEAEEFARRKNLELASKGRYVGSRGEKHPDES